MSENSRPDTSIVHYDTARNEPQHEHDPYALAYESQEASGPDDLADPDEPPEPPVGLVAGPLTPPRRFLLCLDDDPDLPLIETIPPDELTRIDPALVHGHGLEIGDHALLSLSHPGSGHRELARCESARSALTLFSRARPLRLIFLDSA